MLDYSKKMGQYVGELYGACTGLAALPVAYTLFSHEFFFNKDYRTYAFVSLGVFKFLTHKIAEMLASDLPYQEDTLQLIYNIIESTFKGIEDASELVLPLILGDIVFQIRDKIPHYVQPLLGVAILGISVTQTVNHYNFFSKKNLEKEIIVEVPQIDMELKK